MDDPEESGIVFTRTEREVNTKHREPKNKNQINFKFKILSLNFEIRRKPAVSYQL